MREGVPFSLKSIEDKNREEKEGLLSLIYEEVEDDLNYRVKLEFSYREIYFMNDFDEYVDEDNVDEILEKVVEEIKTDLEEDRDKDSIIGIQAFHFKISNY